MERVRKENKYWFINSFGEVVSTTESGVIDNKKRFEVSNYFQTKEEAETMAKKLHAVLAGAEVIEMPSKEDITDKIFSTTGDVVGREGEITVSHCMKTAKMVVEWLKSKIVK